MYLFRSKKNIHKYKMPSKCTWKFSLSFFFFFSKDLNKNEKEGTQPQNKKTSQRKPNFKNELKV